MDLNIRNSILEITVVENPIIEDVEIKGIKSKKLNELFERLDLDKKHF